MEKSRLMSCPFCGGEARLWHPKEYGITLGSVKCNSCGGSTESFTDDDSAIEAWNNRSNWHTGTPIEEGWYLLKLNHAGRTIYDANYLRDIGFGMEWKYAHLGEVVKWQKIEEKEK